MLSGVTEAAAIPLTIPLSILDLAIVGRDETPADAFRASVDLAQRAEARGYRRIWYAEHHNTASIASSATSVLIAHVAAHTSTIRLGAGGVMLPNHSPLTIAEQFGTLATLHPGRIDLGLGRDLIEGRSQQGRLARADLTGEEQETLPPGDAIDKGRQALLMRVGGPQEARVRRKGKRRFTQSEEALVHPRRCPPKRRLAQWPARLVSNPMPK